MNRCGKSRKCFGFFFIHHNVDQRVTVYNLLLCDKAFPAEMKHLCLLTSDREPTTNLSIDIPKVQLSEPMSFIGVTYKNRTDSKASASLKPIVAWLIKVGNMEHIASLQAACQVVRVSFPSSSVGLKLLHAAWLISSFFQATGLLSIFFEACFV